MVIGETAEVEKGVLIYQGVTLGGTGKDKGKRRHPIIREGCVLSCGAKILGGITVGEYSKIGAGSVVLKDVPPHSTVVGVPGRVVRIKGEKVKQKAGRNRLFILRNFVFESHVVGYHCDEFAVCRFAAFVLNSITEKGVKRVDIASVPRNLYCVTDCAFNS